MSADVTPADLARWTQMHTAGVCSCRPWPCPVTRLITALTTAHADTARWRRDYLHAAAERALLASAHAEEQRRRAHAEDRLRATTRSDRTRP